MKLKSEDDQRNFKVSKSNVSLEQLLSKMIILVMANSGADKAELLIKKENNMFRQLELIKHYYERK